MFTLSAHFSKNLTFLKYISHIRTYHALSTAKFYKYKENIKFQVASLVAQMIKSLPAMQDTWVQSLGSIAGLGRSPEGNGYPF